jgi:hypothetical protein
MFELYWLVGEKQIPSGQGRNLRSLRSGRLK